MIKELLYFFQKSLAENFDKSRLHQSLKVRSRAIALARKIVHNLIGANNTLCAEI